MTIGEKLADELVKLTVTELLDLKKVLKEKYGLEETQTIVAAPVEAIVEKVEEKSEFNLTLKKVSELMPEKMNTIRAIKELLGSDLKSAKELVDHAPSIILEKVSKSDAEAAKTKLEEFHAVVELA
jgi:large subunit ribosomal protein L7/L12